MDTQGCDCKKCVSCCWHNPGWFGSIEEIKGAAKIKGLSVEEFAREYLIQEYLASHEDVIIPAPRRDFDRRHKDAPDIPESLRQYENEAKRDNGKGFEKPASWEHNFMTGYACIFLDKNNRCTIHESKPTECRAVFACKGAPKNNRYDLLKYWRKNQDFIKRLIPKE